MTCPLGSERNTNRYSELGEISINGKKQNKFLGDQEYGTNISIKMINANKMESSKFFFGIGKLYTSVL